VFRSSLAFWEVIEYSATAIVILGAVGEYFVEFKKFPRDEHKRERFGKLSALVLIAGLAAELVSLVRTSQLWGLEIARLNERAAKAELEVQALRAIAAPRWVEEKPFLEALKDQPKPAGVLIVFAEDNESRRLAFQVMGLLFQAGWHVYLPTPIVRANNSPSYLSSAETLGGLPSRLAIVAKDKEGWHAPPFNHSTPYDAL
jgi:hypothetical protein